ncbi:unnamed protein product [Symbiodinium sp. CCMP2456]|nr:unnamed protein product [Symbiodinium sp. CCMP2456]
MATHGARSHPGGCHRGGVQATGMEARVQAKARRKAHCLLKPPAPARVPNRVPKVEAPAASALPAAPNVPAILLPKGSAGSSTGTAEHSIIQAFMEQCAKQENLSDELRELMARVGGSNVQQETKELHRLVKNRSEACAALNQIQSDRVSFEAAWASYTQSLVTLLQEQLAKRQSTLEELDKAQSEWTNKLREVTVQIKQTTGTVEQGADLEEIRSSSSEEMECVVAEEAEREAKRLTRQREMTESVAIQDSLQFTLDRGHGPYGRQRIQYTLVAWHSWPRHLLAEPEWMLSDLAAFAAASHDEPLRSMHVLQSPMPGIATPQMVATSVDVVDPWRIIPVDLRPIGGDIFCPPLGPDMPAEEVYARIRPFVTTNVAVQLRVEGHGPVYLQDQTGAVYDTLPDTLDNVDWLAVRPLHRTAQASPTSEGTTTTTTGVVAGPVRVLVALVTGAQTLRTLPVELEAFDAAVALTRLVSAVARSRALPPGGFVQQLAAYPSQSPDGVQSIPFVLASGRPGLVAVAVDITTCGQGIYSVEIPENTWAEDLLLLGQWHPLARHEATAQDRGLLATGAQFLPRHSHRLPRNSLDEADQAAALVGAPCGIPSSHPRPRRNYHRPGRTRS